MKAFLKNYRQSPRKVRLVADMIKGKSVEDALVILEHAPKRASQSIAKLVRSALANSGKKADEVRITDIRVDEGITLRRIRPVSRGMAHPIRKRTSRVFVGLSEKKASKK